MLSRETAVLIVIDVQGKLAQLMYNKENLFANLRKVISGAQAIKFPSSGTSKTPKNWAGRYRSWKRSCARAASPCPNSPSVVAATPPSSRQIEKSGRREAILVGIETHVCVYQTARDLLDRGLHVEVVADAVSSRSAENKQIALDRLARLGVGVTSTEMLLFELLRTAEAPEFREVQQIIKAERPVGFVKS